MAKNSLILFAIIIIISIFLKNEKFYLNTTNENRELNSKLVYFEDNRINDIEINFGKKTLRHFLVMGRLVEQAEVTKYNSLNKWKKVKIKYKNKTFKAQMKLHGKNPDGHSNGFIYHSYSIKLKKNNTINSYRNFKLIVNKRLNGSKKILSLAKNYDLLSLPINPVKVSFNNEFFSEYSFIPKIDRFFTENIGKNTYHFFREYEEKGTNQLTTLKSFLFNLGSQKTSSNSEHLNFLKNKLNVSLEKNYKFEKNFRDQIVKRITELNNSIYDNRSNDALEYFEINYISDYLTLLIISAENGHQNVQANQQVAYDSATGYFYPFINHDSQTDVLKFVKTNFNIIDQQKVFSNDHKLPMIIYLMNNEDIKSKVILKLSKFIYLYKNNSTNLDQNLLKEINEMNYINYLENNINKFNVDKQIVFEENFVDKLNFENFGKFKNKEFIFNSGKHYFDKTITFPKDIDVIINQNTTFILEKNVSIIFKGSLTANGTFNNQILIQSADKIEPFGVIAAIGNSTKKVNINFLNIINPSEAKIKGRYFSGGISLYNYKQIKINNLSVDKSKGEDGLNIKYSKECILSNIKINNSKYDAIDIDNCHTHGENISLNNILNEDKNGDGIDFYHSVADLKKIEVCGFKDKGISVGEKSYIKIKESKICSNNIGVAIKDDSCLTLIENNIFEDNLIDISIYNKKSHYGSGTLIFDKTQQRLKILKDNLAKIVQMNINYKCFG
jgi:hypothetical protein